MGQCNDVTWSVPARTLFASQITHSSESLTTVGVSLHFNDLSEKHFQMFPCHTKRLGATGLFRQELLGHNVLL